MSEKLVSILKTQYKRKNHVEIMSLLRQDFETRRNWITNLDPQTRVAQVLEKYDCFKDSQYASVFVSSLTYWKQIKLYIFTHGKIQFFNFLCFYCLQTLFILIFF